MSAFDHLESPLDPVPTFYVQAPDGKREWAETGFHGRQETFVTLVHRLAPRVDLFHIPNEGKRSPLLSKRSGIVGGVFDNTLTFRFPLKAYVELKGYDKRGQAGKLSRQQIEWGNRQVDLGWPVACFFCPYAAVDWLRGLGFPIAQARAA